MARAGYKFTPEQIERLRISHLGQPAWNKGTGGCKKGHDPSYYRALPSGVYYCVICKNENAAKYRERNQKTINLKNRVARYKVDIDTFNGLFESQGGKCAICNSDITKARCRIDHDHETGKVRGLLCTACNTGIGLLKDSPEVLLSAVEYLKKNND